MWRKIVSRVPTRRFSSENTPEAPTLYSFLEPYLFDAKRVVPQQPPPTLESLTQDHTDSLETSLHKSILTRDSDEAWKSFKTMASRSTFPSKSLTNSLIAHLSSLDDFHGLKRAFASAVLVVERNPQLLEFKTVQSLLESFKRANTSRPAFALLRCMFRNRVFVPFRVWGEAAVEISRNTGDFASFLEVFEESCRIAVDEKLDSVRPDLDGFNAALEGYCRHLVSVNGAEKLTKTMSAFGIRPDESSFGSLAYLYALKDHKEKIKELEHLMERFGISSKELFLSSLVSGFVKSGNLESVSAVILHGLRECSGREDFLNLSEEIYGEIVKRFAVHDGIKGLATLIIETHKLEPRTDTVDRSVGYGVISACVSARLTDKAHSLLDEMRAQDGVLGLGVYLPILNSYCKDHRTAEATQLVMDIRNSGLELDVATYDSLIDASMSSQDFQSAMILFKDMREARVPDLSGAYLTVMTGLMENSRPELMAALLDEVVEDPRVKIGTHDWNSIIHAFCKAGKLEHARRTFRRMLFLQFNPNEQTYLSLISGYAFASNYFDILMLWKDVKRNVSIDGEKGIKFEHSLVDAFLYALVKGGYFDAAMEVVDKAQEMKIFLDKWRYKQAFMENHKKLRLSQLRRTRSRRLAVVIAFKDWVGLNG